MHSNRKGDVMLKYVLKRLGYILVTLWVIVTCTFFMMKNLPGTPFDAERFSIMTPQQQERVLEMYGLNDSLPMQYVKYIKNMLKAEKKLVEEDAVVAPVYHRGSAVLTKSNVKNLISHPIGVPLEFKYASFE